VAEARRSRPATPRGAALALVLFALSAPQALAGGGLAIVGATVLDGTGRPAVPDGIVVIAADKIDAVGPRSLVALPKGIPYVDGRGRFVVPARLAEPAVLAAARRRLAEGAAFEAAVADALRVDATPGAEPSTLERGRSADLLVLGKDPRASLDHLGPVERAYMKGREVSR
jgi:imidazolonepropionase-like amidohydrolase